MKRACGEMPVGGDFIWGDLLHLGMNMWCDWENPTPMSYGWEETVIRWPSDKVRADMSVWRDWTDAMAREDGVGKLMEMAIKLGKGVRPNLHCGICGEHGGDPVSVAFCHKLGLDYVSCSPFRVPIARLAAAQAALSE